MQVIEKHSFVCPVCTQEYNTREEAEECMNSTDKPLARVGDIVETVYRFGWFDGDEKWVINPEGGRGKDRLMGLYYVVTHIELIGHKHKYHLCTNAMTTREGRGYRKIMVLHGHYPIKLIDAPEYVKQGSKKLIGKKADGLL